MSTPDHFRLYVGDAAVAGIDPAHRGIAYGDGLFETMRVHGGAIPWWDRHWARLQSGAARLDLRLPDAAFAAREAAAMAQAGREGVLKLICSRGPGGRGYAPGPQADSHWQLAWHLLPVAAPSEGLTLRWCATRLARQPLLAGLKHCNRLEQVLARAEWADAAASERDADEGLLCDTAGHVICATAANVFVLRAGRWETPALAQCGVAGVCRGVLLDALGAQETVLTPGDVDAADAVFLCNAVRGILPVARLAQRRWTLHPATAQARRLLGDVHPAFVPEIS
jgi:4-amino-4-deoxychorismate lyase